MTTLSLELPDEAATERLGALLSALLPDGAVVALNGTLGVGKTRLVQAIAAAEGVPPDTAVSPTFVLVNEYQGQRRKIYHFDAYRIRDDDEFLALGAEEYFDGRGICLVEWAERVERCLPRERLEVRLHATSEHSRRAELTAMAAVYDTVLGGLRILTDNA